MRILYACDYLVHDQNRIRYLRRNHDVSVVSFRSNLSFKRSVSDEQSNWFYPSDRRIPLYVRGAFALPLLKRISIVETPDVICASWIWGYPYLAYLARLKPLVAIVVGSEIILDHLWNPIVRSQIRRTLKYADAIVVDAMSVKKKVLSYVNDEEKLFCIPVGVDTSVFRRDVETRRFVRESLGITDDHVLLVCNRWHLPIYGIENLIRAIPKIIHNAEEVRLLLIGDGLLSSYYKRLMKQLDLSSHVLFVPRIPNREMPKYLSASDIYMSPSLSDGTSVSLLEAMSCELPVAVTDLPAIREWVSDGENGLLIERSHPSLIAKEITEMLSMRSSWERIGRRNRRMVVEKADMNATINELVQVFEYAIEKCSRR